MLEGIDVSHHNNPATVPWAGCAFACVRLSWGTSGVDALAAEHLARARDAGVGMLLGFHYAKDSPGADQAAHFLDIAAKREVAVGPLGHAVDLEDMPAPAKPYDVATYSAAALDFVAHHRGSSSRLLGVYGNRGDLARFGHASFGALPLWLAAWVKAGQPMPAPPKPWQRVTLWQHGVVDGLDRNRFDGTPDELREAFGLPVAVAGCPVPA